MRTVNLSCGLIYEDRKADVHWCFEKENNFSEVFYIVFVTNLEELTFYRLGDCSCEFLIIPES